MVLTALGGALALLADLWWATGHLLISPSGPAVTMLAGAVLVAALACLAGGARLARISTVVPQLSRARALRDQKASAKGHLNFVDIEVIELCQCAPDAHRLRGAADRGWHGWIKGSKTGK